MSEKPKRIQRRRTKGWTMPEGAVYVGRPSKWGNPFRGAPSIVVDSFRRFGEREGGWFSAPLPWPAGKIPAELTTLDDVRHELRGKNLACWCPLDQPCHADVLLEWANAEPRTGNGEPGTESTP